MEIVFDYLDNLYYICLFGEIYTLSDIISFFGSLSYLICVYYFVMSLNKEDETLWK